MAGRSSRTTAVCQIEACSKQAMQHCYLCTGESCAAHGHWVQAAKLGAQRGAVRPEASLWLCDRCLERLGVIIPQHPQRRHLAKESTPTQLARRDPPEAV